MPTNKEVVANRPLAGHELRAILERDFASMLAGDGMFAAHIGYRRVAYSIEIRLQVDNPMFPEHKNKRESKQAARNLKDDDPMKQVEPPPLTGDTADVTTVGMKRERKIDSPNQARLENSLPVTISTVDKNTGAIKEQQVQYDKSGVPPTESKDTDTTDKAKQDWGG